MIGGSADVTQGSFEHTVRMQPKGVELVAFSIFARYGGNVLVRRGNNCFTRSTV